MLQKYGIFLIKYSLFCSSNFFCVILSLNIFVLNASCTEEIFSNHYPLGVWDF